MVGILFLVIISLSFTVHLLNVEYGKRIYSCLYQTAKGKLQILQDAAVTEICLFYQMFFVLNPLATTEEKQPDAVHTSVRKHC